MKIAYNGLFLSRPYTGMGQYTSHLLGALATELPKATHVAFVPEPLPANTKVPKDVTVTVVAPRRLKFDRGLALDHWEARDLPRAVAAAGVDIYHTPYPTSAVKLKVPVVVTVHDMIPWRWPAYRRGLRQGIRKARQLEGIKAADHICTVSEASKRDIIELAGVAPSNITVAYNGLDPYYSRPVPAAQVTKIRREFGLQRPYVMYFGGYDARKNVRRLVRGFAHSGLAKTHDLVLAGAVAAPRTKLYNDFNRLPQLVKRTELGATVRRTGWLTDADKRALLKGASSFVYPSLAEGFGLPILEALAVGTPVAASQIPTTEELFGEAVQLFNPEDEHALAEALTQVTHTPNRRLRTTGRTAAKAYRWESTAKQTANAYRTLLR